MKIHTNTIRVALAVNDPNSIVIGHSKRNPRKWVAQDTGGGWLCTASTRKDAVKWGRVAQADIIREYIKNVRAYCAATGAQLI